MIKFDTHIHTLPFSTDSHQQLQDVLAAASTSPYGCIITEHMDYGYLGDMVFEFNPRKYLDTYGPFRNDRLLLGIEMGLTRNNASQIKETLSEYPFDMVIGSVHVVANFDVAFPGFFKEYHKHEAYQRYLVQILECLQEFHDFDTLGHIDYICRYSPYEDPELHVAEHKAALEAIFNFLIAHDICLEINTRRLGTIQGYNTLSEILRLYSFLDGRYVTVGSDSHRVENLSVNFDAAEKLINEHHLIPVYFKNRKRME